MGEVRRSLCVFVGLLACLQHAGLTLAFGTPPTPLASGVRLQDVPKAPPRRLAPGASVRDSSRALKGFRKLATNQPPELDAIHEGEAPSRRLRVSVPFTGSATDISNSWTQADSSIEIKKPAPRLQLRVIETQAELREAQQRAQKEGKYLLVDFFATWCHACGPIVPILEELAAEKQDKVTIVKVDHDKSEDLLEALGIAVLPTLILFKGTEEVVRKHGGGPNLKKAFAPHI